jgi:hypothetical protein
MRFIVFPLTDTRLRDVRQNPAIEEHKVIDHIRRLSKLENLANSA